MSGRCLWQCARQGRQFQQAFDQQQQQWASNQGGWIYPSYVPEYVEQCSSPYPLYDTLPYYQQLGWFPEYQGYPFQQFSQPMPYLPCYQQQSPSVLYDQSVHQDWQSNGSSPAASEWGNFDRCDPDLSMTSHFNRWLTKRITETSTPKELLQLIQQKGRYFDKVHLAAGYVQAARLQQDKSVQTDSNSLNGAVEQLCLRSTPQMLSLMDGWTLSNTMWGLVKTKYHTSQLGKAVSKFLIAEVERKAETFKSQELSITAWSLARMKLRSGNVLNEISRVALQRTRTLGAQAISNTLWAFASLNQYDRQLFEALVTATSESFNGFDPQGLSNVLWALAQMGHYDEQFMHKVCDFLCGLDEKEFNIFPVGLSQIIVALGRFNYRHEQLLDRIIAKVVQDFSRIDQQSLCNTFFYWALLKQDYSKLQTLAQEIFNRYENGGLGAFKSADLQRIYEGVQLFECQGLQVDFPEELLREARKELAGSYGEVTVPQKVKVMIQQIVEILGRLGENPIAFKFISNPVYEVPIGVEIDGKQIGIFAVGARMYSNTKPYRKSGLMVAKQQLLRYHGWKIVDTPIHDWERLQNTLEQENYLKKKINSALGSKKYNIVPEAGDDIKVSNVKG